MTVLFVIIFQLSNVVFLLLPPILMHLFKDYGRFVNPAIHLIWFLLMLVGISSAYFHATLSLMGNDSKFFNNGKINDNNLFIFFFQFFDFRSTIGRIDNFMGIHGGIMYIFSAKILPDNFS